MDENTKLGKVYKKQVKKRFTDNEMLYIFIIVVLLIMFGAYIYSDIVMSKRQANWTEADWEKYYEARQEDSNQEEDYQLGGQNLLGD